MSGCKAQCKCMGGNCKRSPAVPDDGDYYGSDYFGKEYYNDGGDGSNVVEMN